MAIPQSVSWVKEIGNPKGPSVVTVNDVEKNHPTAIQGFKSFRYPTLQLVIGDLFWIYYGIYRESSWKTLVEPTPLKNLRKSKTASGIFPNFRDAKFQKYHLSCHHLVNRWASSGAFCWEKMVNASQDRFRIQNGFPYHRAYKQCSIINLFCKCFRWTSFCWELHTSPKQDDPNNKKMIRWFKKNTAQLFCPNSSQKSWHLSDSRWFFLVG